jgi:hypothetical protein
LEFESRGELLELVKPKDLKDLTASLRQIKDDNRAKNDALMALSVYGRRRALKEQSGTSEFGFRTWWLTSEVKILSHTRRLVGDHEGARYMMRPEFLLNFLALAPTAREVRAAYRNIFPTVLGVRLAKRMDEEQFHELMKRVRESDRLEDGRRQAEMSRLADELKSDFEKNYFKQFERLNG